MIALVSPAKTLDFEPSEWLPATTLPSFLDHSEQLIAVLQKKSAIQLQQLMSISESLAQLNASRYTSWQKEHKAANSKPAVLAFKGDVYLGLQAETFSETEFQYAQQHLRILSGLYGLLKPLDLIQPYRLEMGTKLQVGKKYHDLYHFWGSSITEKLNQELAAFSTPVIVNLASNEYFKAVTPKQLAATIITPVFKELKNGQYKVISFFAKKARGMMAAYMINNQLSQPQDLKSFSAEGYHFNQSLSKTNEWVFTREQE